MRSFFGDLVTIFRVPFVENGFGYRGIPRRHVFYLGWWTVMVTRPGIWWAELRAA